jgi:hypothetical protein
MTAAFTFLSASVRGSFEWQAADDLATAIPAGEEKLLAKNNVVVIKSSKHVKRE